MGEWSLQANLAEKYKRIVDELKVNGMLDDYKMFLTGGIWRNFLIKYREANLLYRRVFEVSRKARRYRLNVKEKMPLFKAQCNDGYWHGIFGGLYLPHLRHSLWRELITMENHLDTYSRKKSLIIKRNDIDLDGEEEIFVKTSTYISYIKMSEGGGMIELSHIPSKTNLCNVISRRFEHYYKGIDETKIEKKDVDGIQSIHEICVSGSDYCSNIVYDKFPGGLFTDRIMCDEIEKLLQYEKYLRNGNILSLYSEMIEKEYRFNSDGIDVRYRFKNKNEAKLYSELSFFIPGCNSKMVSVKLNYKDYDMKEVFNLKDPANMEIVDNTINMIFRFSFRGFESGLFYPINTISKSEKGYDMIFQGLGILLNCGFVAEKMCEVVLKFMQR